MPRCLLVLAALGCASRLTAAPPNVLLVLSDDQSAAHVGCYGNPDVRTPHIVAYLRGLYRQLGRPLLVVIDRLNVHRSAVRELRQAGAPWLHVEWLPPYAPDLNPVEAVWGHAKCSDLANFVPDDIDHLYDAVIESVGDLEWNGRLKHSFFQTARLPL